MRGKYGSITVLMLALGLNVGFGVAWPSAAMGTLDSPAVPAATSSYTLQDIWNRLTTGAMGPQSTFTEPGTGPAPTMHTLNDIMSRAPAPDTNGATTAQVLTSKTFWGLRTDGTWGTSTGTMPDREGDNASTSQSAAAGVNYFTAPAGSYDGDDRVSATDVQIAALDADLNSGNLKQGVNIFGVNGTYALASVPETGQTTSYATGDDGALRKGVTWPTPRFTDNTDGTVTDNLTRLVWLKDANCINTQYPSFDTDGTGGNGAVTWQHALDFVAGINAGTYPNCGAGQTDWRLPNVREQQSLIDYGQRDPALPNPHPFTGVKSDVYWTSTTVSNYGTAWYVRLVSGRVDDDPKTETSYVWPVRGGE